MRMRNKPWVKPELESSPFYLEDPYHKNEWHSLFPQKQPLYLELGCGKGNFIAELAAQTPQHNFLGIDMKSVVLASACRNVKAQFAQKEQPIDNVLLTAYDIERILDILGEQDLVERIYINFCNPWPKERSFKKRLTHSRQLERYKTFLKPHGSIHFKTDDDLLFAHSLDYFRESGFTLSFVTQDLHQSDYPGNIQTEHEKKFTALGVKTKLLIADWHPQE